MRKLAIVLLFALLLSACAPSHTERPNNPEERIVHGEKIYVEFCSECHQADGGGWSHLYPRFAGNPIVTLHDPSPLIVTVLYGLGSMPAFRDRLSTDEIADVLTYIRNTWGNTAAAVSPRQIH
jgi:mono/diheme cytochrome c family protein